MDYNTRLVILGCVMLGAVCGLVGVFLLLRKRSLIADAICHASLPGIAIAFFVSLAVGGQGREPLLLLAGAALTGCLGALAVMALRRYTRLKEDAALGIVLSVFFALGMVLLSLVQQTESGNAAGLEGFIYGNTAGIVAQDAKLIAIVCAVVCVGVLLLRKELQLLCFDPIYAAAQGWPVLALDLILMGFGLLVVIVGTSIVGVLLVVAMVVIPPAAARFWSDRLGWNLMTSSFLGATAGILGAVSSYRIEHLPSGASMVLVAAGLFALSLLFGSRHGIVWGWRRRFQSRGFADQEHLLRGAFELLESEQKAPATHGELRSEPVDKIRLSKQLNWSTYRLERVAKPLFRKGWIIERGSNQFVLSPAGIQQSHRAVRRHRLLELYFSHWADLSPDAIDRCADYTEHSLDDELLARLERDAMDLGNRIDPPASIHPVG
jgi:manganese/zinc/iron transport system permease protein